MRPLIIAAALLLPPLLPAASAGAAAPFVAHAADIVDEKAVIGTVEPVHELAARARIGGTIASLTVKEGQEVPSGGRSRSSPIRSSSCRNRRSIRASNRSSRSATRRRRTMTARSNC